MKVVETPLNYIDAIHAAENAATAWWCSIHFSHAWEGKGGVLELHDQAVMRQRTENSYTAWRDVTPLHRDLVEAMLASPIHVIATMRSKMDYVQEKDANGKTKITKIGLAPVQRQGMEYEFTLVADMDVDHSIVISKSRCNIMADKVSKKPDVAFWMPLVEWLNSGEATPELTPEERVGLLSLCLDAFNKLPSDIGVNETVLILGKGRVIPNLVINGKAKEPFEQDVVSDMLHKLPNAPDRINRLKKQAFEEFFWRHRRATNAGIHLVERGRQLLQGLIHHLSDAT